MIFIKRTYDPAQPEDGQRFLVDRLWPRGVSKERLQAEAWLKEAAPSNELRRSFGHTPEHWQEFRKRYRAELRDRPETWQPLLEAARQGDITLLYSAKNTELNNAVVLKEFLEEKL